MIGKILFAVVLALGASWLWSFLCFMGYHKLSYNHQPGACHLVKGIGNGSEDMEIVSGSLVLITNGVRAPGQMEPKGRIMLFDFSQPNEEARVVSIEGDLDLETFNPHGLSVWRDPEIGTAYVFVVNHLYGQEAVERFQFVEDRQVLLHLETITDNTGDIHLLNDVSAVGPTSFYYTNFQYTTHWLEVYAQLHWGSIGFYDGKNARVVAKGYLQPNGHHLSKDEKLLYVGHIGGRSILVFERQPDNGLKQVQEYKVLTSCDNLDISADGKYLWAGCVRTLWQALLYVENPKTQISPSQVMRFTLDNKGLITDVVEVYSDNGKFFSGSSSAVAYKDAMLVGSVHSNTLYCQVKSL